MNKYKISIHARFRPEILERVLRVVRHRGFHISVINMVKSVNTHEVIIDCTVYSERSVHLLLSPLNKLIDISIVKVKKLLDYVKIIQNEYEKKFIKNGTDYINNVCEIE